MPPSFPALWALDSMDEGSARRIAVTGASGFVGSRLCDALQRRSDSVVTIDVVQGADPLFPPISVLDAAGLSAALAGCDAVIHLAGPVAGAWNVAPRRAWRLQVQGTENVVKACLEAGVPEVILASSFYVYQGIEPALAVEEGTAIDRTNLKEFALAKFESERLCREAGDGLRTTILRFGPLYGPSGSSALSRFLRDGVAGQPVVVWGKGHRRQQYTYVDDVVRGALAALADGGGTFNLISGESSTMRQVAELLERDYDFEVRFAKDQPEGPEFPLVSSERAKARLNWHATELTRGIGLSVEALRRANG